MQDDDPNGTILPITLEHLADNGVSHKSDKISLEVIKMLPGIYLQEIDVSKNDRIFCGIDLKIKKVIRGTQTMPLFPFFSRI